MRTYVGTFLIAFSNLALEILLARLLSVVTWYHLAFFAISTAMLGMTAGAVRVYLAPERFTAGRYPGEAGRACLAYAIAVPVTLLFLCLVPIGIDLSAMVLGALLLTTFACAVPFYFSGIAITLALTKTDLPIGNVYAADLIGAGLGCLFVLGGLELRGVPSLVLWCAAIGALAGYSFSPRRGLAAAGFVVALGLTVFGATNSTGPGSIYPMLVKGRLQLPEGAKFPGASLFEIEKWNSLSRVTVEPEKPGTPHVWGPSPKMPLQIVQQRVMYIDGGATTSIRRWSNEKDIEHLKYDVVNLAYYLRPKGGAAIIGVGGGKDMQAAFLFGHERAVGIDVNPALIELLTHEFRKFAGLADHPGAKLVADEARSYLSTTKDRFAVIQMSLVDTWAATQAGAFTLSENALYTVEAWTTFLRRLTPGGVFTVARHFDAANIAETGRTLSLGVAALLAIGVEHPARHLAMVTRGTISTLLLSNQPFSSEDIAKLVKVCGDLEFDVVLRPDQPPTHPDLAAIAQATSREQLAAATSRKALNYDPPTDDNPYFFNLLRLSHLRAGLATTQGVLHGNVAAAMTLMSLIACLVIVALATIIVPLFLRRRSERTERLRISGLLYFALIGTGFMLVEIALIQRLSVFLGHPTYALSILLFGIVISTGAGSWISERLPLTRAPWFVLLPLLAGGAIYGLDTALRAMIPEYITADLTTRILASLALVLPLGLLLGCFFPLGMRFARQSGAGEAPWYWALNGVFGLLSSTVAVFVSVFVGVSMNFRVSAICYASLVVCVIPFAIAAKRTGRPLVRVAAEPKPGERAQTA